jgi:hypothetical protein
MSTTVTKQKSEREQIVALRRQAVFMFIATHLDADGCFSQSDQYIANTVAASNRNSVSRTRQSLEASGDVMVIESDRRDAKGKSLPNRVRPVPTKTFWVREWVRNGSKAETSEHGEIEVLRSRVNSSNGAGVTHETGAPVSTAKTRAHEQKNSTPLTESLYSLSVEQQSTAYSTRWSEHGQASIKYIDPPVKQALTKLRKQLDEAKSRLSIYSEHATGEKPEKLRADVRRIECAIAVLEGRQ